VGLGPRRCTRPRRSHQPVRCRTASCAAPYRAGAPAGRPGAPHALDAPGQSPRPVTASRALSAAATAGPAALSTPGEAGACGCGRVGAVSLPSAIPVTRHEHAGARCSRAHPMGTTAASSRRAAASRRQARSQAGGLIRLSGCIPPQGGGTPSQSSCHRGQRAPADPGKAGCPLPLPTGRHGPVTPAERPRA